MESSHSPVSIHINRKPPTHIISNQDTRPTIYIKALHCFQEFSSNSIHS